MTNPITPAIDNERRATLLALQRAAGDMSPEQVSAIVDAVRCVLRVAAHHDRIDTLASLAEIAGALSARLPRSK